MLIATPVAPALEIPINAPDETTENPCNELLLIETVVVPIPALLEMPVIVPAEGLLLIVRIPALELPSWLLLIFIAPPAAPVLEIPINAAVEDNIENPCKELLLIFAIVLAAPPVFIIPVMVPVEALLNARTFPEAFPNWL